MKRALAFLLATCALAAAQAGTGLVTLRGLQGDGPVTVFYPTAAPDRHVQSGPFALQVAPDAPPAAGNQRLVVISHGSGGNAWVHSALAQALVAGGFIVALPEHHADNAGDPSRPGPASWKLRPVEVSRAIDAVAADGRFAGRFDVNQVGMYGMSAGGHTALVLAGGRWSPAQLRRHCEAHLAEDFSSCVGLVAQLKGDWLDGLKKTVAMTVIRYKLKDEGWYTHEDPRIRAIVAGVPYAVDFDPASLANPRVPLALVTARGDRWLTPRFHSDPILAACRPRCELLADLPAPAGHGALLAPPPPLQLLGPILADLVGDPPGFDRSQMPAIDQRIVRFFERQLLDPRLRGDDEPSHSGAGGNPGTRSVGT